MAVQQPRADVEYGTSGEQQGYADQAAGYLRHSYGEMQECISEYPLASTLAAFGIGLGVGLLVGATIAGDTRPRARHWYDLGTAEDLGRRMLDAMAGALPDSIAKRIT